MAATIMTVTVNGGVFTSGGASLQGNQRFSQFVGFGDSNTDSGYFFTHPFSSNAARQAQHEQAVAVGGGLATDPRSLMNSTMVAAAFGTTAIPYGQPGGTNYAANGAAVSGARTGSTLSWSITEQIATYLSENGNRADPNALYYISGGGNSATEAERASASLADQQNYMIAEAHRLSDSITALKNSGARAFVIQDLSGGASLSTTFNATLWADLAAANISFVVSDVVNLIKFVTNSPGSFGISNVIKPPDGPFTTQSPYNVANGGSSVNSNGTSGWAKDATQTVSATAPDTYLWADGEHLSAAGQRIEAAYAANAVSNAVPVVAQVLRATQQIVGQGGVSASELSFQWQRELDGQSTWMNIAGATRAQYSVTTDDVGSHLRVVASYARAGGDSASAISPSTPTVIASAPQISHLTFYDTNVGNTFTGAASVDVANYFGPIAKYAVSVAADKSVTITGPNSGTDKLTSVERIQFTDGIVALDTARNEDNAGSAYRMYQAAFNRTPDKGGVSFWTSVLDRGNSLDVVAQGFVKADEFKGVYGTNPSNSKVVDLFYQNVLGRPGETEGRNFWIGTLDAGASVATVLKGFANSPENHARVDPVIAQGIALDQTAFLV